jgi:hypothetical protein
MMIIIIIIIIILIFIKCSHLLSVNSTPDCLTAENLAGTKWNLEFSFWNSNKKFGIQVVVC